MSRLAFREAVTSPRPRAATLMVALATATLAITGQVAPWALVVASGAIAWSGFRGERPAAWQKSRLLLNSALALCVATGLAIWLRGGLAIVGLAHFAVLTQGLQLLDSRPRRSEFLLVALALFQVTMAANLTDSTFFPILLVAFTVSAVWTLIVHTLRAEAIEAGQPAMAQRVLSKGLMRTTLAASAIAVLLSAALFPILPRVRSGAIFDKSFGRPVATSGFSDEVTLGDLGKIRMDPTVVLRVERVEGDLPSPGERYWRGLAFDRFDGVRWSVTPTERSPVIGNAEMGVDLGGPREGLRRVQRITREEIHPGVLFTAGLPVKLSGGVGRIERDVNGGLYAYATSAKRIDYSVISYARRPDPGRLAADRATPPRRGGERYLQLPELAPEVRALAERIVAEAPSDAARAEAIATWLRTTGRYSDTPPSLDGSQMPIEAFLLGETRGHCEYFASSMVVLARLVGLPTRLVNGFASGRANRLGGFVEVAQSDAHTWVEIHFDEAGWVRFDPTPPDLRMAGADAFRAMDSLREVASAIELWWFRNVVDFDRGHQARALRDLWFAWRDFREGSSRKEGPAMAERPESSGSVEFGRREMVGLGVLALLMLLVVGDLRRRQRTRRAELPASYARALSLLRRRGHTRGAPTSARAFAREVGNALPPDGGRAFATITEAYLCARFGSAPPPVLDAELAILRDSLRA
jgi:transglutaminase-like putative cysteine protease